MHDQIGLIADRRTETCGCRHTDHHEERCRVYAELRSDRQGDRETKRRSRIVCNQFRKDIGDNKDNRQQGIRSHTAGHTDNMTGYQSSETGILHRLADSKGTGNRNQNIPGYIFGILFRRENLGPRHDDGRNADKEKHIQPYFRERLFHHRQLPYRGAYDHKDQQAQCQPAFRTGNRFRTVRTVGKQKEDAGFTPCRNERIVRPKNQRIAFVQRHPVEITGKPLSPALHFFHDRTVMAGKVELAQCLVDTRKTGT